MTRRFKEGFGDAGGPSRAYVDTHYFLSVIFEEDVACDARRLFYSLQSRSYRVLVPQLVLGEINAKILEKTGVSELHDRFQKYASVFSDYGIDHSCLPGVGRHVSRCMSDLLEVDDQIDPNDALIVSQVLADPDSKFFFTNDTKMLDNQKILGYEYELRKTDRRNTRLKIIDWLD
ncbi:MAG: hypothetical protein OXK17_09500 [Thaumarchaeota archaeon]|nr:hypothetical protein [Nitrososphaerota archaeon]